MTVEEAPEIITDPFFGPEQTSARVKRNADLHPSNASRKIDEGWAKELEKGVRNALRSYSSGRRGELIQQLHQADAELGGLCSAEAYTIAHGLRGVQGARLDRLTARATKLVRGR